MSAVEHFLESVLQGRSGVGVRDGVLASKV